VELNKAGLLIGVLAFIWAVPLAVLANMLTPRATTWWSTTSRERIKRRIAELDPLLQEAEGRWIFTGRERRAHIPREMRRKTSRRRPDRRRSGRSRENLVDLVSRLLTARELQVTHCGFHV
jgi:hypothetical protein